MKWTGVGAEGAGAAIRGAYMAALFGLTAGGCADDTPRDAPPQDAPPPVRIEVSAPVDTIVSTASGLIAGVSDLTVDAAGRLYVVDSRANAIHVFDPEGLFTRTLGGEGSGPGKLNRPAGILIARDSLVVVDAGNGRVQVLDSLGIAGRVRPLTSGMPGVPASQDRFFQSTSGTDPALVSVLDSEGLRIAGLGEREGSGTEGVNFQQLKEEVANGEIPAFFRNFNNTVPAADGGAWLVLAARPSVERYSPQYDRLWTIELAEAGFAAVLEGFREQNANASPNSVAALLYVSDAQEVAGDLWLLLATSDDGPAGLRVIRSDGTKGSRLDFPGVVGARRFAVNGARSVVYFSITASAELLRVTLDPDLIR